ncbi:MAG TPA: hypothetical protein VFU02_07345 [Polyangiaceae bacterium]|nr:hypothetical protein [Polyangiaceae bacterium]
MLTAVGSAAAAPAAPDVVVEISPAAGEVLNDGVTRRLIHLELAEVKVAPNPTRENTSGLTLFYRLVLTPAGELRIELWELGEFYGARRVSTAHGDKKLLARHIALATAELAQRLSRAHSQEAKQLERRARQERDYRRARLEQQRRERWALVSQGGAAWLPDAEAWLAGPRLGLQLNHPHRGRVEWSAAWLFGTAHGFPDVRGIEWLEVRAAPQLRFDAQSLAAGVEVAAATVALAGPVSVDTIPNQRQTWSARAGFHLEFQPRIAEQLRLNVAAEAAYLLRNIPLRTETGDERIRGAWFGLNVGVVIEP